jgi:hypothetical protein
MIAKFTLKYPEANKGNEDWPNNIYMNTELPIDMVVRNFLEFKFCQS